LYFGTNKSVPLWRAQYSHILSLVRQLLAVYSVNGYP